MWPRRRGLTAFFRGGADQSNNGVEKAKFSQSGPASAGGRSCSFHFSNGPIGISDCCNVLVMYRASLLTDGHQTKVRRPTSRSALGGTAPRHSLPSEAEQPQEDPFVAGYLITEVNLI